MHWSLREWSPVDNIGAQTTMTLVPQVVDAVSIPVIAAGGIADGRGFAAAYDAWRRGSTDGNPFCCCKKNPRFMKITSSAWSKQKDIDSEVTGMSTGHPIRVIRNKMTREYLKKKKKVHRSKNLSR